MLHDTLALTGRLMKHITRSIDTVITTALMPVAFLLLFRFVFGGAVVGSLPADANYTNYLIPGIVIMTIGSSVAYTTLRVYNDMSKGITSRLRTMPISRSAVLWAHVLTSLVSILLTLVLVIAIAFAVGFRPEASFGDWLGIAGITVLVTLALTWLAVIPGMTATSAEASGAYAYPLIFLPFLSSAFVPTETMPGPLRWFAENQPFTSVIDTLRNLIEGQPVGNAIWVALAWIVGVGALCYVIAVRTFATKR